MNSRIEEYDLARSEHYSSIKDKTSYFYWYPQTLLKLIGDVKGKQILDVGCGDGVYCRFLKQNGAEKVIGTDLSQHMIDKANQLEIQNSLGCQYMVKNALDDNVEVIGQFDIVIAIFVLVYADNVETLTKFCRHLVQNLKPGGRCLAFIRNCTSTKFWGDTMAKYGFHFTELGPTEDGGFSCKIKFSNGFTVTNFCLRPETYEKCFCNVGFSSFEFKMIDIAKENWPNKFPEGFWDEYYANPHQIVIVAEKKNCN